MELKVIKEVKEVRIPCEFEIECAVKSVQEKTCKNGSPLYKIEIEDNTGTMVLNGFENDLKLVKIAKMCIQKYPVKLGIMASPNPKGGVYINIDGNMEVLKEKNLSDYCSDFTPNVEDLKIILNKYMDKLNVLNTELYEVCHKCIYDDDMDREKFFYYPAGIYMHHSYPHGLLYHTVSMLELAEGMMEACDKINRYQYQKDFVYAAIILHDFFKIKEYKLTDDKKSLEFDVDSLLGHSLLASEYVHDCYRDGMIDKVCEHQLKHILAAHHGSGEFGAITSPSTKEALLVHYIDEFNAKDNAMDNELVKLNEGQLSHDRNTCLDSRVYKPKGLDTPKDQEDDTTPDNAQADDSACA